ncbi:MAG: hypothetical protein J7J17_00625 [Hadesarchaea archaeon]|nr:hypothetical protein [Hadesarchaea archaeon]
MPQAQITLTPPESKRLIAKAVAKLEEVRRALRRGTIVIGVGTTNGRVAEEILGRKMDLERFAAGVIVQKGTWVIPKEKRMGSIVIRKGKVADMSERDAIQELSAGDVFIKGANLLDSSGMAGVLLANRQGGTIGRAIGALLSRGVNIIIPVGLEKFAPGSVKEAALTAGIDRPKFSTGVPVGVMPLPGKVITEIEAIETLTGARAVVIGRGGVSGGEGSVVLAANGSGRQIATLERLVNSIKGEKPLRFELD